MLEFSDVEGLRAVVYCLLLFCSMMVAAEQCVADGGLALPPRKSRKQDLCCLPLVVLIKTAGSFHFWLQFRPVWPSPLTKRLFWAENVFAICPKNPVAGTDARQQQQHHSQHSPVVSRASGAYWLLLESLVPVDLNVFLEL